MLLKKPFMVRDECKFPGFSIDFSPLKPIFSGGAEK
jgi:hypothetical protein